MGMLFARAAVPLWLVVLAVGAFLAPAGMARTVLLVALGLACIPAVITAGIWKRRIGEPGAPRPPDTIDGDTIDAEFKVRDVTPKDARGRLRP
jgi:hypothetical protein